MSSKKHKEQRDEKKLRLLSLISFLFGFAQAVLLYVTSDYFSVALGSDNVSAYYFIAYAIALVCLLNMHKVVKAWGKARSFFFFFMLQLVFLLLLVFVAPSLIGSIFLMGYIIVNYAVWTVLDVIIEDYSEDKKSGRIRGLHLTILSAGILVGPYISTSLLEQYGFDGLFIATILLNAVILVFALIGLSGVNGKFRGRLTVKDVGMKILTNKDVLNIYVISLALEAFYALMVIYMPLYLLSLGISWQQIGIAFTVMLIPFVVLEYPIGILADTKFGEKEMIIAGLLVMGLASAVIFFIHSTSLLAWSAILLLTRIGAATVEILRDSYFFKKIDGRDVDLISFFRTTRSVAYLFAMGLSAMLLIIASMKYIFLLIAVLVLLGLYPALKLVDNKSEAEM